jgi:hypothetical protein
MLTTDQSEIALLDVRVVSLDHTVPVATPPSDADTAGSVGSSARSDG